jgi:hypothetical protein
MRWLKLPCGREIGCSDPTALHKHAYWHVATHDESPDQCEGLQIIPVPFGEPDDGDRDGVA